MDIKLIFEAILLGLTLTIMLGPIFITVTQIAIERGAKAGLVACTGVWVSDVIIVAACYFFIQRLNSLISDGSFTYWMGLFGGFILIAFGFATMLSKAKLNIDSSAHSANDYLSYWTKGFLVNTVNPFTFIFWIGVISNQVIGKNISLNEGLIFFGIIILIIMMSDTLKVFAAKLLRKKLNAENFGMISKIAGVCLIIFGLVMLFRTGGM